MEKFLIALISGTVVLILGLAITSGCVKFVALNDINHYDITVTRCAVKRYGHNDLYLVYAKTKTNQTRVFRIEDSFYYFRFDSSDVFASIESGKSYRIKTYGWRVPFLSWYENILTVKPLK